MRGIGVVAGREIFEKRLALLVSVVAGLIVLAPLFFAESFKSNEARGMLVLCGMASFGGGAAILFGASTLGRELKEKRLPFFFSRPLAPSAIWGGKLVATFLLSLAMAGLCALPATLVFGVRGEHVWLALGVIAVTLLYLVALSDVISSALRSRSPWVVIDFVLLAIVIAAVVWAMRKLFVEGWWGFGTPTPAVVALVVGVPLLILLSASYARVAVGRTDIRRAHGAQSVVIWGLALPVTAALTGFAVWLSSPTPADLLEPSRRHAAPTGGWEVVRGPLQYRLRGMTFLRNPQLKEFLRVPRLYDEADLSFSGNGRRATWVEYVGRREGYSTGDNPYEIAAVELDKTPLRIRRTGLFFDHGLLPALSQDGMRLAAIDSGVLSVYDITDPALPKLLAKVRLPDNGVFGRLTFSGNNSVLTEPPDLVLRNPKYEARLRTYPRFAFDILTKTLSRLPPASP